MDPGLLAIIGTVFGGVGLKVVEYWLGKSKERQEEIEKIQNRLEIEEEESHKWRTKYYQNEDYILLLRRQLVEAGHKPPERKTYG